MTNIDTLHKLIKFTKCSNYEISYLHPFVLSKKCKFAIANSCSTVLADFKVNNVKTIEYSAYSKKLLNNILTIIFGKKTLRVRQVYLRLNFMTMCQKKL